MAKNKSRASLKPVVKAIARTAKKLKSIRASASPAEKKKLDPKIKAVDTLASDARKICKGKSLSI